MEKVITIEGMMCNHCVQHVTKALEALPGVTAAVDLAAKTARVSLKQPVVDAQLREAVEEAGYQVTDIR